MKLLKGKNIRFFFILSLFAVCTILFWWYFLSPEEALEINLEEEGYLSPSDQNTSLIFAVAPVISPERNIEDYQELAGYLARELNHPVRLIQRKTYHEINELLRIGKVNIALICTGAYMNAKSNNIPLDVIALPCYYQGGPYYHSLIITRAENPVNSIADLKGKSFAFSDPLSLTGYFYPLYHLYGKGWSAEKFFSNTMFTYSHEGSIKVVLDKITDAAAVNNLVYHFELQHYPEMEKELKIIHQSVPFGINPIVMNSDADSVLKKQVQKVFLEMEEKAEGQRLLARFEINKFEFPPNFIYDTAGIIYNTVAQFREEKNMFHR